MFLYSQDVIPLAPPLKRKSCWDTEASRCYSLVGNERFLVKSVRNLKEGQQKRTRDLGIAFSLGKITNQAKKIKTHSNKILVFHPGESSDFENDSL